MVHLKREIKKVKSRIYKDRSTKIKKEYQPDKLFIHYHERPHSEKIKKIYFLNALIIILILLSFPICEAFDIQTP